MTADLHGVYDGMSEAEYHAHPALSSSNARLLLPPNCPALYKHQRDNPPKPKDAFDFGHAAHGLVLGVGSELVVVEADNWLTKAAKEAKAEAHAAGKVPLLPSDMAAVEGMAEAIKNHQVASALFAPGYGKAEQSLFWNDEATGVPLRARLDWLPDATNGRLIVADYKTTRSAAPKDFAKSSADYGYHQQAAWYLDGLTALNLADEAAFVFVAQEKTAPYLITVFELDADAIRLGRALNRQAIEVYAECAATDTWPGYSDDVALISLPYWLTSQHTALLEAS